jgi:hypothetical protein
MSKPVSTPNSILNPSFSPPVFIEPILRPGAIEARIADKLNNSQTSISPEALKALRVTALEYVRSLVQETVEAADKRRDMGKWIVPVSQLQQTSDPERTKDHADLVMKHASDTITEAFNTLNSNQLQKKHVHPDSVSISVPNAPQLDNVGPKHASVSAKLRIDSDAPGLHITMPDLVNAARKRSLWRNSLALNRHTLSRLAGTGNRSK